MCEGFDSAPVVGFGLEDCCLRCGEEWDGSLSGGGSLDFGWSLSAGASVALLSFPVAAGIDEFNYYFCVEFIWLIGPNSEFSIAFLPE